MAKDEKDTGTIISFRALQLANEQRNAYGLRYNDYNRYRKHCANRTHRLRSILKITHGKGRDFKKPPPTTLDIIKAEHLQLLLFETERAWAYSQNLYAASLQPGNKEKAAKLRHSATGRFRRSIHWCTQLLGHCQGLYHAQRLSAQNTIEISAYTLMLSGRFLRFRDEYEDALEQLSVARNLFDVLAQQARNSRDQALSTLFSDETSPEIRYCAHQLGYAESHNVDRIVADVAPKRSSSLVEGYEELLQRYEQEVQGHGTESYRTLKEFMWEGQPVPIRNPELVDVLLEVQKAEAQLEESRRSAKMNSGDQTMKATSNKRQHKSRSGVAAFDAILAALSDAEEVARKLVEAQKTASGLARTDYSSRDIEFVHAFIVYQLLSRRIERDLTLVSALISSSQGQRKQTESTRAKPFQRKTDQPDSRVNPALVKLLDTVLQTLNHMRNLSIVDEDPILATAIESRIAYTKCRRCLYLAHSHAIVKQYAQALSLIRRGQLYLREANANFSPMDESTIPEQPSFYVLSDETIRELEKALQGGESKLARDWFVYNGGSIAPETNISKKPLFFDIVLNYVQLDTDRLQERAGIKTIANPTAPAVETQKPTPIMKAKMDEIERPVTPEPPPVSRGGGLSSLLGGWWGRK